MNYYPRLSLQIVLKTKKAQNNTTQNQSLLLNNVTKSSFPNVCNAILNTHTI